MRGCLIWHPLVVLIYTMNDKEILNKYWPKKMSILKRKVKANLVPEEDLKYLQLRYSDSSSIYETLYRIKNHIEEVPTCKYCGKKLEWKPYKNYGMYCSRTCKNLDPEQQAKNLDGIIRKFGTTCALSNEFVKEKRNHTWEVKYGGHPFSNKYIRNKIKTTCKEKYGVENIGNSKEIRQKIKQTCKERYSVDNYAKTEECKEKLKNTCIERYGDYFCNTKLATELSHSETANDKRIITMHKNHSWSTSKPEEEFYIRIKEKFPDVKRQYKDKERYPFNCDFYIPSLDLFIELQGHWTHNDHPYGQYNIEDQKILEEWKSKNTKFYNNAIRTWVVTDVKKREIAKKNKLNFKEVWTLEEGKKFIDEL